MVALTNTAETYTANWLSGNPTTAPELPFKLALMSVNGDDSIQGTEISGGSYARQQFAFGNTTSGDEVSNDSVIRFDDMPGGDVVGVEVYDSAATPIRWFYGPLATLRTVTAGDPFEFQIGALKLRAA